MSELSVGSLKGLAANNFKIEVAAGSQVVQPGSILQVVQTIRTTATSFAQNTDVTVFSVNITPSSANSKVLLMAQVSVSGTSALILAKFTGGNTSSYVGDAAGSRLRQGSQFAINNPGTNAANSGSLVYLDSPATTSEVTYSLVLRIPSGSAETGYINRTPDDADNAFRPRLASSLIAMEVAG
jgi:hypothetical protein